jgi:hypothetical protein
MRFDMDPVAGGTYREDGTRIVFDLSADTTLPADRFHTGKLCKPCTDAGSTFPVYHPTRRPCTMVPR